MKVEVFRGISPTCSAVPYVRTRLIKGLKPVEKSILLLFPSSSSSSASWSAAEQGEYDPFSSAWDDPEKGAVELKILCLTAISSAGSGERENIISNR